MQTMITARHCEISDDLRARTEEVMDRLATVAQRPMEAHAVFDVEAGAQTVELRFHVANGDVLVSSGSAADHRSALDAAEAKMRKQLTRAAEKLVERTRQSRPTEMPPA
ncbi:MAG: ribosome-associated translation inhibitor RaiA [Gemmatimonadota bacterium]|nr:ribosome-associated translation inhibitor RaiA [Gemmatimonadota bacterium]